MMETVIKLLSKPSIIEIVSSPDNGRTKFALQLSSEIMQRNPDFLIGYIDSDQQLSMNALQQNHIDLNRFFYLSCFPSLQISFNLLIIDSLPTVLQKESCSKFLLQIRNKVRHNLFNNIIILNQKRFNLSSNQYESYYKKYVVKYCDYSIDLDTNTVTQNIFDAIQPLRLNAILPNILDTTWRY